MGLVRFSNVETGVSQTILTWSHTFCLRREQHCLYCSYFTLFWKAEQGQQTNSDCIFSRWLPQLPLRYNNIIVLVISWLCMYSEACYVRSFLDHNSWTVFGVNKLTVTSKLLCFPLCDLPLPVLFGHPLIRSACRCSYQSRTSHIWGNALFSRNVFSSIILVIPSTFRTKRSTTAIEPFFFIYLRALLIAGLLP